MYLVGFLIHFLPVLLTADEKCNVGFGNDCDDDINVFWVDHSGKEIQVSKVSPRGQSWLDSWKDHKFVFRSSVDGAKVGESTVSAKSQFTAIQCGHPCHIHYGEPSCINRLEGKIRHDELKPVWDNQNRDREMVNVQQPQNLMNFTELGFEKRPIPEDVWAVLKRYYEDNKDSIVLEKWPSSNPYINHWESAPMMIWLPEIHTGDATKQKIFDGLKPHLEEWSGTTLQQTDLYGMRVYRNNTFLENHVDRVATHVVSAIMHIADSGDHAWPLNIISHDGREHNVTIAPGEMVLYESATCPHGRPSKFEGEYYVNAFAHYRPTNWISHLRGLRKEGKLTKWSRGPGKIDNEWLKDDPVHGTAHDEL